MKGGPYGTAVLLFAALPVFGQAPMDRCFALVERDARLECYDTVLQRPEPANPEPPKPAASAVDIRPVVETIPPRKPDVQLVLRQGGDFTNFEGADLVDKPALFNVQRSDGTDSTIAKAALTAVYRPINDLGWQPFGSAIWNRDTSGAKPKDVRSIGLGIVGPLWDAASYGWTLLPTLRLTRRDDRFGDSDSNLLSIQVNVIKLSWVTSIADAAQNSYSFIPQVGFLAENRTGGATDRGSWRSTYGGFEAAAALNRYLPRLGATLTYQRFIDTTTPAGNTKRRANYTAAALTYALTDPDDKSIIFRPFLTLSREVGTDVLGGTGPTNKTIFGLGLKYN